MSKKNLLNFFVSVSVALFCLTSCSKDDDKDDYEKTKNVSIQDPDGTIVLNISNDRSYDIGEWGSIKIDAANNFNGSSRHWNPNYGYGEISFASVGLVNGLSEITQIPTSGWSRNVAVVPGTGYLMRHYTKEDKKYEYARIYVVEYLGMSYTDELGNKYGQATGATIKYQVPFYPTGK